MDTWTIISFVIIGIIAIAFMFKPQIDKANAKMDSNKLARKFYELGDLTGKSISDIENAVGKAQIRKRSADGIYCKWGFLFYSITIAFDDNEKFIGIIEEQELSPDQFS